MTGYDTINTENWKICLPSDWEQRENTVEHAIYFESADKTKGAYFSTWAFHDDPRPAREILESFRRAEVRSIDGMDDYAWQKVDEWNSDSPALTVLGVDFLDRQAHYRIACHLITRLSWLVRSTFHDYYCTDYDDSKRFFLPIIQSLEIHIG